MPAVTPETLPSAWALDPVVLLAVLGACYAYARGVERLRRQRAFRAVGGPQMAAFAAGVAAVLVALVTPLEPLAGELLSAHMVQHLLLVLAAAPLLAAGRPQLVMPHALPRHPRWLARLRRGSLPLRGSSAVPTGLVVAAALHSGALWVWHAPVLHDLALRHPLAHALEHAAFLGTAMALWIALLRPDRRSRLGNGTGVLCIAALLLSGGVLAALITFADTPLYAYTDTAAWGLTPLEDQQLAGAIMWVIPGFFYGIAGVLLFARWLHDLEDWARRRELTVPGAVHRVE